MYDNNLEKGEKFEDVMNDYIQKGFVEILNWRGKQKPVFQLWMSAIKIIKINMAGLYFMK